MTYHDDCDLHKHRAVISWFQRQYIHTGKLPIELGTAFRHAFDRRCEADYTDAAFTAAEVAALLEQARRFVAEVKAQLQTA